MTNAHICQQTWKSTPINSFYVVRQQGNLLYFKTCCIIVLFSIWCCLFSINHALKFKYQPGHLKVNYMLLQTVSCVTEMFNWTNRESLSNKKISQTWSIFNELGICHFSDLIFKRLGWYFNYSKWLMKIVQYGQKKIKFWNKWHFVEKKTEGMQQVLKCSKIHCWLKIYIIHFYGCYFVRAISYVNANCLKVK